MSRETEAKFLVADLVSFNQVKALRELAGFTLGDGNEVAVRDTYHDTSGRALLAAGWALRSREAGGQVLATAKSLGASSGVVHEREELQIRLDRFGQPREWPDGELRRLVLPLIGDQSLVPLFEVNQRRFVRRLAQGGRVAAEMSLDQIRLLAGRREIEYCELEVEILPDGTRDDLSSMLAALSSEMSLTPSRRSKFEEGLLLLDGSDVQPAVRQRGARRAPGEPAGEAVLLEAPADTTEEMVLAELKRLGYGLRARLSKEETRSFFDTQGGALLRQGMELYLSADDSRWHLIRGGRPEHVQKGGRDASPASGPIARAVEAVTRSRPCVPYLQVVLREQVFSLVSISAPRLGLTTQVWHMRSLLHETPRQTALTVRLDAGQASTFDRDYLLGLLAGAPGLRGLAGPFLRFGLGRLGAPLPGAPLPPEFLPADTDDLAAVCCKVLGGEAWRMNANTPGAIRDLDPEFVHDLRVATRRARFACRLFVDALRVEARDKIRGELSWIAGLLGGVRDLDVLRGRLDSQLPLIDADASFVKAIDGLLEAKRRAAREALVPALASPRYSALLDLMRSAGQGSVPGGPPALELARRRIGKALRKIAPWTRLDPAELTAVELHRLRILFKRLRYTAEFFRPILRDDIAALVKACVTFQDCLGLHQDARVASEVLTALAAEPALREPPERLLALGALAQVQRNVMRAQRERFQSLWESARKLLHLWPTWTAGESST
jgi:inorganic triphosphatase YgiF